MIWILLLQLLLLCIIAVDAYKVAVIGGGLAGTATSKYLVDYDQQCQLESVVLFDPLPIGQHTTQHHQQSADNDDWQGNRIAALRLDDGRVVEIGASVLHEAFTLVKEIIRDGNLTLGKPFNVGIPNITDENLRQGLSIYHGDGLWAMHSNASAPYNTLWTLLRYNLDLILVDRATKKAVAAFAEIHQFLDSVQDDTFFESPDDMWQRVNLHRQVHMSFEQLLDELWISSPNSLSTRIRRALLPFQGSLREELLTAINQINYNQGNDQVNGLVGLASFSASKGPLYSVEGGNFQIVRSAFQQAQDNRQTLCQSKEKQEQSADGDDAALKGVTHVPKRITTVVGSMDGFVLYAENEQLVGTFDVVILAAPLQQARIEFMVQSHFDTLVLQPMPLADGMVRPNDEDHQQPDHEGYSIFPRKLPSFLRISYTQVVTTVVSHADLDHEYLQLPRERLPRAVATSQEGKWKEHNITVVSQIAGDGVYKIFSSDRLSESTLVQMFGRQHKVEFVKVWGGAHGGATPDYRGEGKTVPYLLYDGASGLEGHTKSGALYYPNAIESSLACMEASSIGAKSVAKLVAKRLGLLVPSQQASKHGDEL